MRGNIDYIKSNSIRREDFLLSITEVKSDIKDLKDLIMKK